jgi:hypothetical protein
MRWGDTSSWRPASLPLIVGVSNSRRWSNATVRGWLCPVLGSRAVLNLSRP